MPCLLPSGFPAARPSLARGLAHTARTDSPPEHRGSVDGLPVQLITWLDEPSIHLNGLSLGSRKVAEVSVFTALAVATDYAMFPLANIKLMDSIVFVSAIAFGVSVGASVAALTWLVYGTVNPLGPDSAAFLMLLILSEMIYVVFGYIARHTLSSDQSVPTRSLLWGAFGVVATFLYDVNTIVTPNLIIGQSLRVSLAESLPAIPFMLAHEVSNFVFFATFAPLVYLAIRKVAPRRVQRASAALAHPLEAEHV